MNTKTNALAAAVLAAGLMIAAGHAAAIDEINFGLDTVTDGGTPGGPGAWVNAKFLDLGFLGAPGVAPGFAAFKNTVELQITTTQGRDPASGPAFPPPDDPASFGLGAYPDLGVVNGSGNLAAGYSVGSIYFNFNPAKDLSKLQLTWGGAPGFGFPASGIAPNSFAKNANGYNPSAGGGLFDFGISFPVGTLGPSGTFNSKLVFHYNGAPGSDENLDPSDFAFNSEGASTGDGNAAFAVLFFGPSGNATYVSTIIAGPVPEPGSYAMLGVGLAALGFVARRKAKA